MRRWCQVIVVLAGPANSTSSSGAVDLEVHVGGGRLRQRLEQRADGRDRGLVGGEPPVVRDRLQGEPPARAGDRELVTRLGPLRPLRGGARPVQQELDLQRPGGRVVAARRVGADRRRAAPSADRPCPSGVNSGRIGASWPVGGQEHLQVRGRRGVREPVELVAGDEHRHQPGRDPATPTRPRPAAAASAAGEPPGVAAGAGVSRASFRGTPDHGVSARIRCCPSAR